MALNQKDIYEKPLAFISKWASVIIVIAPCLFFQIKILFSVLSQYFDNKDLVCG